MSIKKTLQNKNKKRFTKEEYKYIESVWNVKNYITGQHLYLANLHTSFLCNLIYPTFSRILLYSC